MSLDMEKLNTLVFRMVGELGAAAQGSLVLLGDRLGLYRALAEHGPITSANFATKLGMHERYIREWLHAQVAAQYIDYDPAQEQFMLSPEQAAVFADPDSPAALAGGYWSVAAVYQDEPMIAAAFKSGEGVPELSKELDGHWKHLKGSGEGRARLKRQHATELQFWIQRRVIKSALDRVTDKILEDMVSRKTDPASIGRKLLKA